MPIAHIPSAQGKKTHKASYRRRKDQNSEISELEALLPWSQRGSGIDKISVLRLTSAYLRFKNFWQSAYSDVSSGQDNQTSFNRLFSEALEGFILILSPAGEVVFVSEGIAESVGITQQEVIGVSIYELTHEDDSSSIQENLKPEGLLHLQQPRHFYIRFKSSISPGKKQLSKFGGTVMLQVSGKLRLSPGRGNKEPSVIGLVAECRRIESSSSILELRVPQVMFTSTTTMDLKILSIDTKMKTVTGFGADIEGTVITNFFHPSDNRRSIHCLKTLLITGQASSPIIRFMTHTGEWVWVQIEGLIRYEPDNRTPKYLEATFKVVCVSGGSMKMIEQKELYGKTSDSQDSGIHADSRFNIPAQPKINSAEAIVRSIEDTDISESVRDALLHGRETALSSMPANLDRLATWPEVMDAVVAYEKSKGLAANYTEPFPRPENGSASIILPQLNPSSTSSSSLSNEASLSPSQSSSPPSVGSTSLGPVDSVGSNDVFQHSPSEQGLPSLSPSQGKSPPSVGNTSLGPVDSVKSNLSNDQFPSEQGLPSLSPEAPPLSHLSDGSPLQNDVVTSPSVDLSSGHVSPVCSDFGIETTPISSAHFENDMNPHSQSHLTSSSAPVNGLVLPYPVCQPSQHMYPLQHGLPYQPMAQYLPNVAATNDGSYHRLPEHVPSLANHAYPMRHAYPMGHAYPLGHTYPMGHAYSMGHAYPMGHTHPGVSKAVPGAGLYYPCTLDGAFEVNCTSFVPQPPAVAVPSAANLNNHQDVQNVLKYM